ncbi:PstS family phosphate ABC transporter substrate-binding protein [Thermolongibacillus altinsuensis]|uniref:PstS family phosphate ABC transporter substrate-binding protein n=1 Tax=Thermolongibacillus altinsuensis TaxID=575256 RepID=UPI00242A2BA2|nr:PstS family phosphate ABC transporter substrate-binding protein [Thermolongibacillus altinsuensis]GMB07616.1 phosphate ABC transporter substrate-binding protein [Thermolongibacillus altinsuensis]
MKKFKFLALSAMTSTLMAFTAACGGGQDAGKDEGAADQKQLQGNVAMDGSSTVFPIMEAIAEEYMIEQPNVQVSVGVSGTGGGFEKFTKGETDFSNASRPIKDEEKKAAQDNGIEFEEFKVAFDGISIVVNKENDWVDHLTVEELKKMWTSGAVSGNDKVKWSDIREGWPDEEIKFFSPGHDSGTFDYFNEVILEEKPLNKTAQLSEDDNVLVQGVAGDKNAIGFFGFAYYLENKDKLKVVPIDAGNGPVEPTHETIQSGKYTPLSRPLFTYVNVKSLKEKAQVYDFAKFILENGAEFAEEVGYVALPEEQYQEQLKKLEGLK